MTQFPFLKSAVLLAILSLFSHMALVSAQLVNQRETFSPPDICPRIRSLNIHVHEEFQLYHLYSKRITYEDALSICKQCLPRGRIANLGAAEIQALKGLSFESSWVKGVDDAERVGCGVLTDNGKIMAQPKCSGNFAIICEGKAW